MSSPTNLPKLSTGLLSLNNVLLIALIAGRKHGSSGESAADPETESSSPYMRCGARPSVQAASSASNQVLASLFKRCRHCHWKLKLAQRLKCLPAMRETWVRSLGREDPLEKEMAPHSSILAWRIPWMEEPGGLQSTGSQRVGHD